MGARIVVSNIPVQEPLANMNIYLSNSSIKCLSFP